MNRMRLVAAGIAAHVAMVSQAFAQDFSGFYAGAEIGYSDSEFRAPERAISIPEEPVDFVTVGVDGDDVVYGAFVGWGTVLADSLYVGAELGFGGGNGETVHPVDPDTNLAIEPQWRWGGAARLGFVLADANLFYAKLGYETREYELTTAPGITVSDDLGGAVYGVGFERLLSEHLSARVEAVRTSADDSEQEVQVARFCPPGSACLAIVDPEIVRFALEPEETRLTIALALRF